MVQKTSFILTVLLVFSIFVFVISCKKREVSEEPVGFDSRLDGVAVTPLPYPEKSSGPARSSRAAVEPVEERISSPAAEAVEESRTEETARPAPARTRRAYDPNS